MEKKKASEFDAECVCQEEPRSSVEGRRGQVQGAQNETPNDRRPRLVPVSCLSTPLSGPLIAVMTNSTPCALIEISVAIHRQSRTNFCMEGDVGKSASSRGSLSGRLSTPAALPRCSSWTSCRACALGLALLVTALYSSTLPYLHYRLQRPQRLEHSPVVPRSSPSFR